MSTKKDIIRRRAYKEEYIKKIVGLLETKHLKGVYYGNWNCSSSSGHHCIVLQ